MLGLHRETNRGLNLLRDAAARRGLRFTVTSGFRSIAKQWELYQRRINFPAQQIYPVAYPGTSTHNYGLSFDAVATDRTRQAELGQIAESLGFSWGGRFQDPVHFQIVAQADWKALLRSVGL